jgi:hypothetical protein
MLAPGSYNLSFSAEGYIDKTVSNVTVTEGQREYLTVDLTPDVNNIEIPESGAPKIYPNPAGNTLYSILPEGLAGSINVKISDLSGKIVREFNTFSQRGVPVITDVSRLPGGSYVIIFTSNENGNKSKGRFIVVK